MSLITYTNYTNYKPVANLNAKVKRIVKRTKKVEEKEYKFFPMNAHKRIKLPLPPKDLQKEADKIKPLIAKRTPEDEESIRNHDEHSFYAIEQYCRENDLEFDYDEHKALVDAASGIIGKFKKRFNVDRPFEVDKSIRPMNSKTNKTRSYPSGHACQAMLVALYASQRHPTHKEQLIRAAKEGGLGRVKAGFHYLADYIVGNLLAEKLMMIINRDYVSEEVPVDFGLKPDTSFVAPAIGKLSTDADSANAQMKATTISAKFSQKDVKDLEKFADRILAKYGIDVEFTRHFVDRLNDPRNSPAIKVSELQKFFKKIQRNKGQNIRNNPDVEAVLKDMSTNLNLPVVIKTKGDDSFEVTNKTIMRKKDFRTTSKVINYA